MNKKKTEIRVEICLKSDCFTVFQELLGIQNIVFQRCIPAEDGIGDPT